ncbi:MAG: hypothetical protein ACI87W_003096 [Halieaceae bacterium]|jgi:hypothetical protein
MSAEENLLCGSCLCGDVRYTVSGTPRAFYHCHCSRCRKVSGTGHASNLFVAGALHWVSGEELLRRYQLPNAERFGNNFCTVCGSRLPIFLESRELVYIPAGSLDEEPQYQPQARIFQGSRASWSCDSSELPQFDAYPG